MGASKPQPGGATGSFPWRIVLVALVVFAVMGALITVMVRSSQNADSQSTPSSPMSQRTSVDSPNATAQSGDAGASGKDEGGSERSTASGTTSSATPTTNQADTQASEPSGTQTPRVGRGAVQAQGGGGRAAAHGAQTEAAQQPGGGVNMNRGQGDMQAESGDQAVMSPRTVGNPQGGDYAVVAKDPTPAELSGIIQFLTQTDASDQAKLKNLENPAALVVPQTVSRMGLFRAPRGSARVDGPVTVQGNVATGQLNAQSAGTPTISIPINFVYRDGNWRLASSSMCNGVKTLGLPIFCNA